MEFIILNIFTKIYLLEYIYLNILMKAPPLTEPETSTNEDTHQTDRDRS